MQVASDSTVLGNFNDTHFSKDGVTSSFIKKENKFNVQTEGPDGKPQDYALPYTFGVSPLQQYLVAFSSGRLQSLGIRMPSWQDALQRYLSSLGYAGIGGAAPQHEYR